MKKLFILIGLFILLSSFVSSIENTDRGYTYKILSTKYPQSLGITTIFGYYQDNALQYIIDLNGDSDYDYLSYDAVQYSYPTEYRLPYTLYNCKFWCDKSQSNPDYSISFYDGLYDTPYTSQIFYVDSFNCKYDSRYIGTNVTQGISCILVPNQEYTDNNLEIQSVNTDYKVWELGYPFIDCNNAIWGTNAYVCNNLIEFKTGVEIYIGEDGEEPTETPETEIVDEGESNVTSPVSPDDGSISNDPEDGNTDNLISYNDLASTVQKKNIALWNLIFIEELIFSVILLLFYIFEIAITIYVFTSWIPGIFKALVNIIRKFGEI